MEIIKGNFSLLRRLQKVESDTNFDQLANLWGDQKRFQKILREKSQHAANQVSKQKLRSPSLNLINQALLGFEGRNRSISPASSKN